MIEGKPYSLDNLSEYLGNDEDQIKEMIRLFLDTIPPDVDQMINYSDEKKWEDVYKLAHRIKPTFEVFKMSNLHSEIKTIEVIARQGNEDDTLDIHLGRFLKGFNLVKDMLEYEL